MTDDEDAFELFLARYRWVFLQVLHDLRALQLPDVNDALDQPARLLEASARLGALVRKKLSEMGKADDDVDTLAVRLIAEDIFKQFGPRLVGSA
jgi:hypothetical protein